MVATGSRNFLSELYPYAEGLELCIRHSQNKPGVEVGVSLELCPMLLVNPMYNDNDGSVSCYLTSTGVLHRFLQFMKIFNEKNEESVRPHVAASTFLPLSLTLSQSMLYMDFLGTMQLVNVKHSNGAGTVILYNHNPLYWPGSPKSMQEGASRIQCKIYSSTSPPFR